MRLRVQIDRVQRIGAAVILMASAYSVQAVKPSNEEAIDPELAKRIAPMGKVSVEAQSTGGSDASNAATNSASGPGSGADAYSGVCVACHGTGVAGAPKVGDKSAWAERISQGMDTLYAHAIKGFQGKSGMVMPPKGGGDLSDDAVKAAVDYMVNSSK